MSFLPRNYSHRILLLKNHLMRPPWPLIHMYQVISQLQGDVLWAPPPGPCPAALSDCDPSSPSVFTTVTTVTRGCQKKAARTPEVLRWHMLPPCAKASAALSTLLREPPCLISLAPADWDCPAPLAVPLDIWNDHSPEQGVSAQEARAPGGPKQSDHT